MFKKIVSNLPFSPALIGQLGFYAKRLSKEEATRKLGLIFLALTLVVQYLIVFQPPESANASNATDMVLGGLGIGENRSFDNYLKPYDENTRHLRDTMDYLGITRDEITSTTFTSFIVGDKISWGFAPKYSYDQGERQYSVTNSDGQIVTSVYSRPLNIPNSPDTEIWGWVGHSKSLGWFAIMQSCGNLVTDITPQPPKPSKKCETNTDLTADDENCKPCPGNSTLWINDPSCKPDIKKTKTSTNITQGFIDAASTTARAGDQISYTITVENIGLKSDHVTISDDLSDVLEYSTLIDNGGGSIDKNSKTLSWPETTLESRTKQTRTFIIKILDTIPATARGQSEKTSFDCEIINTFGNTTTTKIECPTAKIVENTTSELPKTGPKDNLIFSCTVLFFVTFFYARSRQLKKEVKIIRQNAHAGMI